MKTSFITIVLGLAAFLTPLSLMGQGDQDAVQGVQLVDPTALATQRAQYSVFFDQVLKFDELAAKADASGKDGTPWKTHIQRDSGISASQMGMIKLVAHEYRERQEKLYADTTAGTTPAEPPETQTAIAGLRGRRIANDHGERRKQSNANIDLAIAQLRENLGENGFTTLDSYVKSHYHGDTVSAAPQTTSGVTRVP